MPDVLTIVLLMALAAIAVVGTYAVVTLIVIERDRAGIADLTRRADE